MAEQHIDDNGEHVAEIERRLRELAAAFADAGSQDDFEALFRIIHQPGWTTLIDVAFLHALIDATERSQADAQQLRQAIVDGARAIAEASSVAV